MDIGTELEKQIDVFINDNKIPISLRPCLLAAAWIGASVGMKDFASEFKEENEVLNEVFNAIK